MTSLPVLRQSAAELLALVVIDLFPGALLVQSAATEFGFYCDIVADQPIDDYALPLLEEKMRSFAKRNLEVKELDMMREVAANYLEHKGQPYRADEARAAKANILSLIQIGEFCDYCPQPYVKGTKELEFFKIFNVEKAVHYTSAQGLIDVKRIHGAVSTDKQSLKKLVKALQAGKKADHTKLAVEMDLFAFNENLSSVSWVWKTNGTQLKEDLIKWWKDEHRLHDFSVVSTPALIKGSLVLKAGVYDDPYLEEHPAAILDIEGDPYIIPSSATPAHMFLFQEKSHSFREMPIRFAECVPLAHREHRALLWGVLNSNFVTADCAHIFCAPEHLVEELISSLQFIDKIIKIFDFEYYWYFKGRRQRFAGTENRWDKAINSFNSAFESCGFTYIMNEQDGSFAGPMIEARLIDSFGREWEGPTLHLDFNAPDRFGLRYQGSDGKNHVPLMIKRSVFGSLEKFCALLLEHHSGLLPVWLAPEQVRVMPIKSEYSGYAKKIRKILYEAGYRVTVDFSDEAIVKKITRAENEKIPYQIIIGDKEENENLITLRTGGCQAHQQMMAVEAFLRLVHEEVSLKTPRSRLRVR